ncbi:phage tail protein, P2 protein I family [Pseudomonas sp. NFACC23-1]|uniref:phage tail protein I n=1 Tax=unclassified Pseudomonas TaxID=196821 RepID=UPI000885757D|nr:MULTISPECIES: phage tail protein I [unclassified Pseudomonas]SDB18386.1 phage tail protein, P2 protein I family [Pseudomonas sp. NFACC17-2]SEJ23290.1 phage tail protein, P2 protein I family [Pseudomonas sp. NFACC23-1]SFW91925.1 phage tail protein, P2 protein I family [Pseudomonas sp. NFACC16-2]
MKSLLPLNSTQLERAIEAAIDETTEIPLRTLYNPDTCPAHLLYQLAWAWSVDRWDESWPEEVKRSVIRSSFYVHAHKGTIGALRRVVEPFGYLIEVVEWFRTEPKGVPGTFALKIGVSDEGISEETYQELTWLIDDARPVSRHMTGLAISLETRGNLNIGVVLYEGDEIDVYPPVMRDIEVTGSFGVVGREHTIDILDVYQ